MLTGALEMAWKMTLMVISILVGIFAFPLVLNSVMNGIAPGIVAYPAYILILGLLELGILFIYIIGILDFFGNRLAGSTL